MISFSIMLDSLLLFSKPALGFGGSINLAGLITHAKQKFSQDLERPQEQPEIEILVHVYQRKNTTLYAEQSLTMFIGHLKAFINDASFTVEDFNWAFSKLNGSILKIITTIEDELPTNTVLWEQLQFATYMFQTMVQAAALLKYYHNLEYYAVNLVDQMIQLNIALFALNNNHSFPDPNIRGYTLKVLRFVKILQQYEKNYKTLNGSTFGTHLMFQKHFLLAENALMELESKIPRKNWCNFRLFIRLSNVIKEL